RSLIYTSHYMEEVERLADHIVIIDHGKVLADESPRALYQRLPAQAALRAELALAQDVPAAAASPATVGLADAVSRLPGVTGATLQGSVLDVGLADTTHAASVLCWLAEQ